MDDQQQGMPTAPAPDDQPADMPAADPAPMAPSEPVVPAADPPAVDDGSDSDSAEETAAPATSFDQGPSVPDPSASPSESPAPENEDPTAPAAPQQ